MVDFFDWLDPGQQVMTAEHLGIGVELETMK